MARLGNDVANAHSALEKLVPFLRSAKRAGVPLVFIRNEHSPETDSEVWLDRNGDSKREQSCKVGTWGADFWRLAPNGSDKVVVKNRYSAFRSHEAHAVLQAMGRQSLLFTGVSTSMCVESSVREAVCRDYLTTVVADCCADYSASTHHRSLEAMSEGHALVSNSHRIMDAWGRPRQTCTLQQ